MAISIPRVQTPDRAFNQYQANVQNALAPVLACAIPVGAQLKSISLIMGDNVVNTGLGRQLNGWFIVRLRAPASLYDKYDTQSQPKDQSIVINASAACVADIWVY